MGETSLKAAGNGKKSDVWEYYEKIKDAPKAKCKLRTHLECKHALLYTHEMKRTDLQYSWLCQISEITALF